LKLLFDENVSSRLVEILAADFPGCTHIELVGLRGGTDTEIWNYARENGYWIVSKDNDFRQRAFLYGSPPKVVWLSVGNAGTHAIAELIRAGRDRLRAFDLDPAESLLVLRAQSLA
jgi:predicted nuclease of predicted toxin-antitoxin system